MYPFVYKISFTDEIWDWKTQYKQGVTFGETFTEAMANIESYYGNTLIDCYVVAVNDEQSVLELSEGEVRKLVHGC